MKLAISDEEERLETELILEMQRDDLNESVAWLWQAMQETLIDELRSPDTPETMARKAIRLLRALECTPDEIRGYAGLLPDEDEEPDEEPAA